MEFRWVALVALWTLISGPIFSTPSIPAKANLKDKMPAKVSTARR